MKLYLKAFLTLCSHSRLIKNSFYIVLEGGNTPRMVEVEIVVQKGNKAFLGGFKNSKTGSEYHHAITQTVEGKKRDWNQITEGKFYNLYQINRFIYRH